MARGKNCLDSWEVLEISRGILDETLIPRKSTSFEDVMDCFNCNIRDSECYRKEIWTDFLSILGRFFDKVLGSCWLLPFSLVGSDRDAGETRVKSDENGQRIRQESTLVQESRLKFSLKKREKSFYRATNIETWPSRSIQTFSWLWFDWNWQNVVASCYLSVLCWIQ